MRETFSYYEIKEKNYLANADIAATFTSLKFEIIKFLVLGFGTRVLSLIFFLKRKNEVLLNKWKKLDSSVSAARKIWSIRK